MPRGKDHSVSPPTQEVDQDNQVGDRDNKILSLLLELQTLVVRQQSALDRQQAEITMLTQKCHKQQMDILRMSHQIDAFEHDKGHLYIAVNEQSEQVDVLKNQVVKLEEELANLNKKKEDTVVYERRRSWANIAEGAPNPSPTVRLPTLGPQDREQAELKKRQLNIMVSGIQETEEETPRSLHEQVREFLGHHFCMQDVPLASTRRVGHKDKEGTRPRLIVCTILDARKRAIILDSSRTYLRGTNFYVFEDRTPKQQEERRRAYAERMQQRASEEAK